jgi:protein involved in polysaccharide export with SLBB domain
MSFAVLLCGAQSSREKPGSDLSYPPDLIVQTLRKDPGLTLEVKRKVARKAADEGRILSAADLTDAALFKMIQDDSEIAALATKEIEKRGYIQALPSPDSEDEESRANEDFTSTDRTPTRAELVIKRLRRDRSLVIAVKQAIMRRAKSLGQTINPAELTDEALFRLISEDPSAADVAQDVIEYQTGKRIPLDSKRQGLPYPQMAQNAQGPNTQAGQQGPAVPPQPGQRGMSSGITQPETDTPNTSQSPADSSGAMQALAQVKAQGLGLDNPQALAQAKTMMQNMGGSLAGAVQPDLAPQQNDSTESPTQSQPARNVPQQQVQQQPKLGSDQPLLASRPNPYANVPALYDLYSQVLQPTPVLERFGASLFRNGTGNFEDLPMDMPVGPDYVLGPGDGIKVELWGGVSERLQRVVDREGRIGLPEVGAVLVAGRSLGDVQREVQSALRTQFRDVQADISVTRLRSVRVYVVGDVQNPGAYDISALSTPLNAVYAAGGPAERGSIRTLRHYRGKQLVQEVDVYDIILHGVRGVITHMESGDTILVPPAGGEVTVEGMVRRPAIYELAAEKNLAQVLAMAGGVMSTGTLRHIEVERIQAHQNRVMLSVDVPATNDAADVTKALEEFAVQDGDRIRISPILPYSDKTVYLDGHVFRPGKYTYRDGMRLSDLIKSYSDLLPEPSRKHAEVIRLAPPDFRPQVIAFNLESVFKGGDGDLQLQAFDTVRIFSRYDFEDPPEIKVTGEVRDPGVHRTNGETHLRDAVFLAGGTTPDALLTDVQVFRHGEGTSLRVINANLGKALAGDVLENILLQPRDQVVVHRNLARLDPPVVYVQGEVASPGKYPLSDGMTAAELVRIAGGPKRSAYTDSADLSRYAIQEGQSKVTAEHMEVKIAKALSGDSSADIPLNEGDVLSIRQISGWNDIGSSATVSGEVNYPGTYGIRDGERLSSLIKRAGGFHAGAFPAGAVLERVQVRDLSEQRKQDLIRRMESEIVDTLKSSPVSGGEQKTLADATLQQQRLIVDNLKEQTPNGRLVIRIGPDVKKWENTPADVELRAGDLLIVPKRPDFVLVTGQVYNPTTLSFSPGKSAGWYLTRSGGPTELANKKSIFVIRADGSVVGQGGGWWSGDVLSVKMNPGDSIVVPEKMIVGSSMWKNLATAAQIMGSMALTATAITRF